MLYTSVRLQLSWFLLADFDATPASSCELGRLWPVARLVGPCADGELSACRSVVCSPRDVADRDDSESGAYVLPLLPVSVCMVCAPCPPPFAGRFSGVCGRCCLNESLSSFVLHVLRLSSTEVLRFAIVFSSSLILFDSRCSLSLASTLSFSRVWVKASIFGKAVRTFSSSVIFEYMRCSLSLASVLSRSSESCKPSIFDKSVCRAVTERCGFAEILPEFAIFAGFCDISEDWHDFECGGS